MPALSGQRQSLAQENSGIFRGRYPDLYNFRYNGTYFWDRKEFYKADVMYNGVVYKDLLTNIDAASQNVIITPDKSALPVILNREQVSWVKSAGRQFVNLNYIGYPDAPEGFFEILKDDATPVLVQVIKKVENLVGNRNGGAIGYVDPDYDPEVITAFAKYSYYYIIKDNTVEKISKRKATKQLLRESEGVPQIAPKMESWHGKDPEDGALSTTKIPKSGIGLPENYFSQRSKEEDDILYQDDALSATYRNKTYTIGEPAPGKITATLSGVVTDRETGNALPGTLIYNDKNESFVRSDRRGRYSIELPVGENVIHFLLEGKEDTDIHVNILSDGNLNVDLPEKVNYLKESIISASSMANHRQTQMGIESISMGSMNKIPTAFGEGDILRAVMTLPGVKSVGEASGGFNVRGGSADENLILFNENTIYNPSHLFGIFSAFNPDIVDKVDLYKSSVPAEYGGRLSSVMKVTSKEGDTQRVKGSLGIGILTGRAHLEVPLFKGKTTFIAGARTTYSNWILKSLPKTSTYAGANVGFYDINAGLTHRFTDKDALQLSFYTARDTFALADKAKNSFGNLNGSVIFRHKDPDGASWQISTGYDQYTNETGDHSWEEGAYNLTTKINQGFLKYWWKKTLGSHTLSWGGNGLYYILAPGSIKPFGEASVVKYDKMALENAIEGAVFVSDVYVINDSFAIDGALRMTGFTSLWDSKVYGAPEVRFSAKYSPVETFSVKAGVQTIQQYIHLVSNSTGISPLDTWKLSDQNIKPTSGFQTAGGLYWTDVDFGLDFSTEVYYKRTWNGLDYRDGAKLSMNENLYQDLARVFGKAYGVELMVKKPAGNITGWASYSYSRAQYKEMEDHGYSTIAGGKWYNAPCDKPHEFKMAVNWALTHRYSLSFNVDYSTGRPITVPVGQYDLKGATRIAYSERNAYRIPYYFRIDGALNIDPGHYLKALAHTSVTVGVYNILGRKNPYSVYFDAHTSGTMTAYMISVFATQIPYVNLNILF